MNATQNRQPQKAHTPQGPATKIPASLRAKLIVYRLVTMAAIAYLLVWLGIINDSRDSRSTVDLGVYIFGIIIALPLTAMLDKYIVRFAKKY